MPDRRVNKLTDRKIRALTNAGKAAKATDGGGLTFIVTAAGYAYWQFRYSFGGKRREIHIGSLADYPLTKARDERTRLRGILQSDNPQDPARVKKARRQAEAISASNPDTFEALAQDWLANVVAVEKPEIIERVLRKWINPEIGELAVGDIKPSHVIACLRKIEAAGARTVVNDARRHIRKIFDYGVILGAVAVNPAAQITQQIAGSEEVSRSRFLSLGEIRKLYRAMAKHRDWFGRDNELTIRLLIMLGVRKSELIAARWSEVDVDVWTIPAERIKTRKKGSASEFRVPLPPQAAAIFDELRIRACVSEYVLPARRQHRRAKSRGFGHISPDTINVALAKLDTGLDPFTIHDLRRTTRSHLSALGVPFAVAERCLNHKLPGQGEIYDRHDLIDQRREALNQWADCLGIVETEGVQAARKFIGGADVVPMRRRA